MRPTHPYGDHFPGHGSRAYKMIKRTQAKRRRKGLPTSRRFRYRKNRAGERA